MVADLNQENLIKEKNLRKIRNLEVEQEKIEVLRKTIKTRKQKRRIQKKEEDKITLKNISRIYNETRIINNWSNNFFYG